MIRPERLLVILPFVLLIGHFAILFATNVRLYETPIFYLATVVLTLYAVVNCWHLYGGRTTAAFFVIGCVLGWTFEQVGVVTGHPFGPYHYTDAMGPLLGVVPYIIPPAWAVLIYLTLSVTNLMVERTPVAGTDLRRIVGLSLVGAFVTTAYNLGQDPFMAFRAETWVFDDPRPGPYFGVPVASYTGWLFASFIVSLAFRLAQRTLGASPPAPVSRWAGVQPLLAFAGFAVFFTLFGYPEGARIVALLALGTIVLAAGAGFMRWTPSRDA